MATESSYGRPLKPPKPFILDMPSSTKTKTRLGRPEAKKARTTVTRPNASKKTQPGARLDTVPIEVLENIIDRIPMIHLPSVVAVASACRSLREDLGAIAPWKHIFFDLKADEIESEESEGERRKIRYDEVDPKDLKPKRGKGLIDWHWVLAKYAPRLCLGCITLSKKAKEMYTVSNVPILFLDDLEASWDEDEDDNWEELDDDELEEACERVGSTSLCLECRKTLYQIFKDRCGNINFVPGCEEALDAVAGKRINRTEARRKYRIWDSEAFDDLDCKERVVASFRRWDIIEYLYKEKDVLKLAWETHFGPWGLAAVKKYTKTRKRRQSRKLSKEEFEAVSLWKGCHGMSRRYHRKG